MPGYQKAYRLLPHGQNLLKVPARVGGTVRGDYVLVRLVVDTGASFTIISVEILKALGYDTDNPLRRQEIVTGQGRIYAPVVRAVWFNCVGQLVESFEVVAHSIPPNLKVDGLLGMDFLTLCRAVIDVAESEIRAPAAVDCK